MHALLKSRKVIWSPFEYEINIIDLRSLELEQ